MIQKDDTIIQYIQSNNPLCRMIALKYPEFRGKRIAVPKSGTALPFIFVKLCNQNFVTGRVIIPKHQSEKLPPIVMEAAKKHGLYGQIYIPEWTIYQMDILEFLEQNPKTLPIAENKTRQILLIPKNVPVFNNTENSIERRSTMRTFQKSSKLDHVCYEIRGPVLQQAKRLEEDGYTIIKLNTGNPPAFGINAPDEIIRDAILNIKAAEAYGDSKGLFPARKAIMQYCQIKGIEGVGIEDIYIGNGASEMIVTSMQGLLNPGDEILVPAPDYPLWTAAVNLSNGTAVHYICDEAQDWIPDLKDLESKITSKTKGIVVINPNNPTGAVYPIEVLRKIAELAEKHQLIVFADEIYDQILYDGAKHIAFGSITKEILCVTFNGLSKSHRIPGMRAGWMIVSGNKAIAKDYIEGLDILVTMRLCGNMTAQYTIQTALGGYQSLTELISPGGRLYEQRNAAYEAFNSIPGISCVKPKGTLYLFPKIDLKKYPIQDDQKFVLDFLVSKKVLLVQGTGFNWPTPDHFRVVFLPDVKDIQSVAERMRDFLKDYQQ